MKKRCEICFRFLKSEAYIVLGNAGKMCVCKECVETFNLISTKYRKENGKWRQVLQD